MQMLSKRLSAVLHYIEGDVLADIGTDHGYLPIEAVKAGKCKCAIACDVNKGPINTAKKNIQEAGLSHLIETRLGDGLKPIKQDEACCITISGMGGTLMYKIISAEMGKAKNAKLLILQPQHDVEGLRRNLHVAGFGIYAETLVEEEAKFYIVLATRYVCLENVAPWTDKEYFMGKFLTKNQELLRFYQHEQRKINKYVDSISDLNQKAIVQKKLRWIHDSIHM